MRVGITWTSTTMAEVFAAFWHRTRRTFVPLTRTDIIARSGCADCALNDALQPLIQGGLVRSKTIKHGCVTTTLYELTDDGREQAASWARVAA